MKRVVSLFKCPLCLRTTRFIFRKPALVSVGNYNKTACDVTCSHCASNFDVEIMRNRRSSGKLQAYNLKITEKKVTQQGRLAAELREEREKANEQKTESAAHPV